MMMDQTALTVIEGDARIADKHLQQVLGYARINDLHRVIRKHEDELADYGPMLCRSGKASSGQTTIAYYPNEAQATLICMFARTDRAAQARKVIVEVFTAWRRGQLEGIAAPQVDPFAAMRDRVSHVADHLMLIGGMDDVALKATHLPIWKNGRRPDWWSNIELRRLLTVAHRQMTVRDCRDKAVQVFGVGVPSPSAIARYWMMLDTVLGPGRAA
jgi:hypothetical protein